MPAQYKETLAPSCTMTLMIRIEKMPSYLGSPALAMRSAVLITGTTYREICVVPSQGTCREALLAAAFGVGPVMEALSYSSMIPGFFIGLLGGINGPFHGSITAALSKRSKEEAQELIQKVSTLVTLVFSVVSLAIFVFAGPIIRLLVGAPLERAATMSIATVLKLMAPVGLLSALNGVGFGSLTAAGVYGLPSLSPSLVSLSIMGAVVIHWLRTGSADAAQHRMAGGVSIAAGLLFGICSQFLFQARRMTRPCKSTSFVTTAQAKAGMGSFRLRFKNLFKDDGVKEVMDVMIPASVASGMFQFATYTDLYFASFIPGSAAALNYANLLVMAPLGVLSTSLLVPILPVFARLSEPSKWSELKQRVREGLVVAAAVTLPLSAIMIPLATPIVRTLLERSTFNAAASSSVSSLVICYVIGATSYLARDVLVRVFYALGDGQLPFRVSILAVLANAFLDWFLVRKLGYGVQGLILATLACNTGSAVAFLLILSKRFGGMHAGRNILDMQSLSTGLVSPLLYWLVEGCAVGVVSLISLVSFFGALYYIQLPELENAINVKVAHTRRKS
eukprot:SM000137S00460  [mRNA]  locus=s137:206991:212913:+ [translate_table: standard]